nr:hypothetical protein CFP56_01193 [Quercus suber]
MPTRREGEDDADGEGSPMMTTLLTWSTGLQWRGFARGHVEMIAGRQRRVEGGARPVLEVSVDGGEGRKWSGGGTGVRVGGRGRVDARGEGGSGEVMRLRCGGGVGGGGAGSRLDVGLAGGVLESVVVSQAGAFALLAVAAIWCRQVSFRGLSLGRARLVKRTSLLSTSPTPLADRTHLDSSFAARQTAGPRALLDLLLLSTGAQLREHRYGGGGPAMADGGYGGPTACSCRDSDAAQERGGHDGRRVRCLTGTRRLSSVAVIVLQLGATAIASWPWPASPVAQ